MKLWRATWLVKVTKRYRAQMLLALVLGLATYGCAVLLMFTSGYLISKTAAPATTLFSVLVPVAFVQLFGLGRPVGRYAERLVSHDSVFRLTSRVRVALFQAACERTRNAADSYATGELLQGLASDVGNLQNLYLRIGFPLAIADVLWLVASLFCGFFSWQMLALMILVGAVCVFALPALALVTTRSLERARTSEQSRESISLIDDILGRDDWRMAGRARVALSLHESALEQLDATSARIRSRVRVIEACSIIAMGIASLAAALLSASSLSTAPDGSFLIAAFALGMLALTEVFSLLPATASSITAQEGAVSELSRFLEEDRSTSCAQIPACNAKASTECDAAQVDSPCKPPDGPLVVDLSNPAIQAYDVCFAYPENACDTLSHLSTCIPSGQHVAILGRSGSGKSTFLSMLCGRLECASGHVNLFERELASYGSALPQVIARLDQAPYLFSRTIRENLVLDGSVVPDEALSQALRAVGLGQVLEALPQGLDTPIGETGVQLSGGEAHRLALARVLLSNAPIVVLDEPFNALDDATEAQLLDTLLDVLGNRTIVLVTHHLMRIDRFDRVLLMEEGRFTLDGSPAQLERESAHFRSLLALEREQASQAPIR